tara:strand:+ start:16 stop:1140 length:1125 start_codon:yes stop_codon:yes gene_type:complete
MAKYTLYRRDDLSGNVVADDTKTIVGPDGIERNELEHYTKMAGYTVNKEEAEGLAEAYANASTSSASDSVTTVDGKTTTRSQVYTLLPWLQKYAGADANTLVDAYVKGYNESGGSAEFALAEMRFGKDSGEAYKRVFANIVDPDTGALKMTESEYISGLEKVLTTLTEYGLNGYASAKGKSVYATLVANNVSPESYTNRVKLVHDRVINRMDDELKTSIINQYNEYFTQATGTPVSMGNESILAIAIDPNINEDVLAGRLNASEIGAVYTGVTGDALDLGSVQRLTGVGVTTQSAERQFATASATAKILARMQRRQRRDVTLGKAMGVLEAQLFGDESITTQIQLVQAQNVSSSSVQAGAAKAQTGGVIGLTEY